MTQPHTETQPTHKQVNVRLPVDLVERMDARRNLKGISRDKWVTMALEYVLNQQQSSRNRVGRTIPRQER